MSGVASSWYSALGRSCNVLAADAFDRVLGEPVPRQVADRFRARPSTRNDARGPRRLRLDGVDRVGGQLGTDPPLCEVVPNQRVAGAALGELLCSSPGEPLVVDCSRTHEAAECLASSRRNDLCAHQSLVQLTPREVAASEGAHGLLGSLAAQELASQAPGSFPIELDTDVEPRRQHDLGRQGPPVLAVEGDLDSRPRPSDERANSWRRPLRLQP